jgi:hypothetical protein
MPEEQVVSRFQESKFNPSMPPAIKPAAAPAPAALTPEQEIAALKQQLADAQGESQAKDAIIEGQATQLAVATLQGANSLPIISHEGKHYQVLAAVFGLSDGTKVKAEDLKTNTAVVTELVESGSGILQLIELKAEA